jgi:hypothetical protein
LHRFRKIKTEDIHTNNQTTLIQQNILQTKKFSPAVVFCRHSSKDAKKQRRQITTDIGGGFGGEVSVSDDPTPAAHHPATL